MGANYRHIDAVERYVIMGWYNEGHSLRAIARRLCRSASSISREIRRNLGDDGYNAFVANRHARNRLIIPRKPQKLQQSARLRHYVQRKLDMLWSPQQICGRIRKDFPSDKEMRISHETIYAYIYAMPKGLLRKELIAKLRRKYPQRGRKSRATKERGRIADMISIHDRPQDIEGRQIFGHWEGDLIIGKNHASAVGTLVERKSRYLLLTHLEDKTATQTRLSFIRELDKIPSALRASLTYDQGKEMAQHKDLASELQMDVYFCDPHAPWQRGTNENTNGLIRQFLPKGSDLSDVAQDELDHIAKLINGRPRKVLDFKTPQEVYFEELKKYHATQ